MTARRHTADGLISSYFKVSPKHSPSGMTSANWKAMKAKFLIRLTLLLSLTAATPAAFSQDSAVENLKPEEQAIVKPVAPPEVKQDSLADLVSHSVTFSTLKAALKAAELDVVLGGKEIFTLFAPTDEAFEKLPVGMLGKLMLPENKEKLRSLLLYHVIPGQMLAADLKDGDVKTMNGEKVKIDIDGDKIQIGDAKVFSSDVMAKNGVMHSIGTVLVPKSLEGFTGLEP